MKQKSFDPSQLSVQDNVKRIASQFHHCAAKSHLKLLDGGKGEIQRYQVAKFCG